MINTIEYNYDDAEMLGFMSFNNFRSDYSSNRRGYVCEILLEHLGVDFDNWRETVDDCTLVKRYENDEHGFDIRTYMIDYKHTVYIARMHVDYISETVSVRYWKL